MKKSTKTNEQAFYDTLKAFFVGPVIEGQGGFVRLFKARQSYYQKLVSIVQQEIEKYNSIKNDIYGLLNEFLTFSTDQHFFWDVYKWFYYVKTDVIFQNMSIESNGFTFFFDTTHVSYKKNNEKRSIVYELKDAKDNNVTFLVHYIEGNVSTNIKEILNVIGNKITEQELKKVFRKYERKIKQTERDFFIYKDIRNFLQEKLKLWLGQYVYNNELTEDITKKLQTVKEIIHKLINLIGNFEDNVLKLLNTPRAVINANYVITLDRIAVYGDKGTRAIDQILNHHGMQEQIEEWKTLGIVTNGFSIKDIKVNFEKYKRLPIDTKYFKDLEIEILSLFDDLDNDLDGWLIKSENYQALNTLLPKFKEKVQTIYIDPPFNLESSDQFLYRTNYKDSTWATLLENRLRLAKDWLNEKGSIFVRCDYNGNWIVRCVMDEIFGKENFRNEIIINRKRQSIGTPNKLENESENIFLYSKSSLFYKNDIYKPRSLSNIKWTGFLKQERRNPPERYFFGKKLMPSENQHFSLKQEKVDKLLKENYLRLKCKECGAIYYYDDNESRENFINYILRAKDKFKYYDITNKSSVYGVKILDRCLNCNGDDWKVEYLTSEEEKITDNWKDISSYSDTQDFSTENSEELLKRVIEFTSNEGDLVMDFFLGSGTTTAVAHKLKRKWIGIEMGDHFYTVILPRMKKVLAYDKSGISKQVPQYKGGGFFVYLELEQFEDVLNNFEFIL